MSKGLGLGLALALAFAAPAPAEIVGPINTVFCNKTASVSVSSATTITLVSGISAATINWCGWHTTSTQSGSTTFQFEYGAAPGCANPTTLGPPFNVTSSAPSADHQPYATASLPTGASLCLVTTGSPIGISTEVWFSQF
jgi:hypothetical protein